MVPGAFVVPLDGRARPAVEPRAEDAPGEVSD